MLPFISLGIFTTLLQLGQNLLDKNTLSGHINLLFLAITISSIIYFYLLRKETINYSKPWAVILLIMVCAILTPAYLQNDQYRYVWDGFNIASGINPYKYAPIDNPLFSMFEWATIINHPELPTIYPPLAEILFWISSYLNPYFIFDKSLSITNVSQVLIGWKILIGLLTVGIYFFYRKKRWDLIVCHPLYLYTVFANTHVDVLLILPMAFLLKSLTEKRDSIAAFSLTSAVLLKWYPIVFFPGLLIWIKKQFNLARMLTTSIMVLSILLFTIMVFYKGSNLQMFSSLEAYGGGWYFNGFFHHVIMDLLQFFMPETDAIQIAKLICICISSLLFGQNLLRYVQDKIEIKKWLLNVVLIYVCFVPTLMPWYLLILLPFSLEFGKRNTILWLWPILTITSKAFFYNNQDPIIIRYLVFFVILFYLFRFFLQRQNRFS